MTHNKKTHTIELAKGILVIRSFVRLDVEDVKRLIDELVTSEYRYRFFDWTVSDLNFDYKQMQEIVTSGHGILQGPSCVANVIPEDRDYGVARIFSGIRDSDEVRARAFRNCERAWNCLTSCRESD